MRSLLARPLPMLALGLASGALLLALLPSSWLFRPPPAAAHAHASDGRRWACPMFCTMSDKPGLCPVCGMTMEPVVDQGEKIPLKKRERAMIGIRTSLVRRARGVHRLRALGRIGYDEGLMGHVTAWVGGRLDKLYVEFTGTHVAKGEKIAEIYAPELVSAQEELLSARRAWDEAARSASGAAGELRAHAAAIHAAARRRLRLLGLPETLVAAIESDGRARDTLAIQANVGGTVLRKRVNTGDYVKTGASLFDVVDLSKVWVQLEVFEEDAGSVFIGQQVEVEVPGLPGEIFRGPVSFVDPVLDEKRRILRVRVELPNPDGRLKPGAFVDAHILVALMADGRVFDPTGGGAPGSVLLLPRSAVLDSGDRKLVYVMTQEADEEDPGNERWPAVYEPREIRTGLRVGEDLVVLGGLEEGDAVVTRGQFLLDSQLQLTGKPSLMNPEASAAPMDPHAGHRGSGTK